MATRRKKSGSPAKSKRKTKGAKPDVRIVAKKSKKGIKGPKSTKVISTNIATRKGPKTTKVKHTKVQKSKGPSKKKRKKRQRKPSLADRIRQGMPLVSAWVMQHGEVQRLRIELEEAERKADELAERAAIQAEEKLPGVEAGTAFYEALRWLRQDSTRANHPSILRHMDEANEWRRQLQMIGQGDPDDPLFRRQARLIAEQTGVALKEVYTLWWSP